MTPYNLAVLFFAYCTFILNFYIYLKRRDAIGKLYFIFGLFSSAWGIGYAIMIGQNVPGDLALFAGRIANAAANFIGVAWFHFTVTFVESNQKWHRKIIRIFYGISAVIALFSFSPWFIPGLRPMPPFPRYPIPGILYTVYAVIFLILVSFSFVLLFQKMLATSDAERKQWQGFIISTLCGFTGGSLTFLPIFAIPFPQYGIFVMPFYPVAMAYFMTKDKLMDVEEFAYAAHKDKLTAMGILAASINHEIKSPLYVIQNFAENYLDKEKSLSSPEEIKHYVRDMAERIKSQSARASEIVQRLSAFAKVDMIKEVYLKPVRLTDVLANILPLIRYEFKTGNVTFVEEISSATPSVLADRRCLEQVFFNLLINAYQAIQQKDGEKIMKVSARENNDFVEVAVSDNGPGISPAQQAQIFKPFYTTKEKGSGLGLYVTKQLVEKMKGRIRVESGAGKGTRFVLELPKSVKS